MSIRPLLFSLLLAVTHALADGVPRDKDGIPKIPHTIIKPTPSQVEELEALGTITLSKEQWNELRKVSPSTPKRLVGVLPVTWNDCSCGISYDAFEVTEGRIAIPHRTQTPQSLSWAINPIEPLILHCDRRGQFYLDGMLVRYPVLLEAIQKSGALANYPEAQRKSGEVSIKVPLGIEESDPVFEDRIVKIYEAFLAKGWTKLPAR